MTADEDCWTFFWKYVIAILVCLQGDVFVLIGSSNGDSSGPGTGCIRSPDDGSCGCENSDGTFVTGSDCS